MNIETLFDPATSTLTYVVFDPKTQDAVIIDPVLDFDAATGICTTQSIQNVMEIVQKHNLKVHYILETHVHADHLSGAKELVRGHLPTAKIAIGERIKTVQSTFKKIFNMPDSFTTDGAQFARLFCDNETFMAGVLKIKVLFTPGHTPACVSYHIDDAVFTGDALFMPDSGTGRCDFPDGDAEALYQSVSKRLYSLPDDTRVFVGHDYQPNGRPLSYQSTIGEEKLCNIQLRADTTKDEFVTMRRKRDATLNAPKLLLPSIQVNIAAGALPPPESNGQSYLKVPIVIRSSPKNGT